MGPLRGRQIPEAATSVSPASMNSRPHYSSNPSEEPASPHAEQVEPNVRKVVLRSGFFSISAETFPDLSVSDAESAVAPNTGVTAYLGCFKWLR